MGGWAEIRRDVRTRGAPLSGLWSICARILAAKLSRDPVHRDVLGLAACETFGDVV
jgi:hypothetical protein